MGSLLGEISLCIKLRQHKEAKGIYGAMLRLVMVRGVSDEALRSYFAVLKNLPECYCIAEHAWMLANSEERELIKQARMTTCAIKKAARSSLVTLRQPQRPLFE